MSILFSPLKLRSITFRNRIFVSPMCQYSSSDGIPTDWHLVHLGSRAVGGAGLVMVEATAVSPEGRISPDDSGLWNDTQAEAFAPITRFIRGAGRCTRHPTGPCRPQGVVLPRLGSAAAPLGVEARGWQPLAPSADPFAHRPSAAPRPDPGRAGRDRSPVPRRDPSGAGRRLPGDRAAHGPRLSAP